MIDKNLTINAVDGMMKKKQTLSKLSGAVAIEICIIYKL